MTTIDPRALAGARYNADLYEAMFAAHDLRYHRLPYAFAAQETPRPHYSHITMQSPAHGAEILDQIKTMTRWFGGRIGLKESFCRLDLADNGFSVLFEASWIWREASGDVTLGEWLLVRDLDDLMLWETAWKDTGSPTGHEMFPPALLERRDFYVLGRKRDGVFDAGCIADKSPDCLRLSNVFAPPLQKAFSKRLHRLRPLLLQTCHLLDMNVDRI